MNRASQKYFGDSAKIHLGSTVDASLSKFLHYLIKVDENCWTPLLDLDGLEAEVLGLEVFDALQPLGLDQAAVGGVGPAVIRAHEPETFFGQSLGNFCHFWYV